MEKTHYIATWFYKENAEEASFYPQAGGRGDSSLLHSVYMQIQVPFFTTFAHYNPHARLLFFTNMVKEQLPDYLQQLFMQLHVDVITLPYRHQPPKGWYKAWCNQFYLYDIFDYMQAKMNVTDTLLVCDADCLCRQSLDTLWEQTEKQGSALYELNQDPQATINGITLQQMTALYQDCYGEAPQTPIYYYGGEFIALRGDVVCRLNHEYDRLWQYNLKCFAENKPKLNEEALFLSVMAEHLNIRNSIANGYVKRMWTLPDFHNTTREDLKLAVWHLPYEKRRGIYRLFKLLTRQNAPIDKRVWQSAQKWCGIPSISLEKRIHDRIQTFIQNLSKR